MFKKSFRLDRKTLLSKNPKKTIRAPFFVLRFFHNHKTHNRYGFVVSKKIDQRAVVRNRIKRLVRSCVEKCSSRLRSGYDMLFIIQKNPLQTPTADIYHQVEEVFAKGKLML